MYLAGVDVVQACAQMGHADVSKELKIYTHLDAKHKRKTMDKMDAYLYDVSQKRRKPLIWKELKLPFKQGVPRSSRGRVTKEDP